MKITAIADTHGLLPEIEPCDVLLIAGDVCPVIQHDLYFQKLWLMDNFKPWLRDRVPAKHIIGIGGNHDYALQDDPNLANALPWDYLCGDTIEVEGLKVTGLPWTPNLPRWAFYKNEEDLLDAWATIPRDVDILMTHSPPSGFGDRVNYIKRDERTHHVGDPQLTRQYAHITPRLHVFGHIHEDRGIWNVGHMTLANVAMVDDGYERGDREPVTFNLGD